MIRNRNFMIGLGIGLIAGALLLQLMLIGQGGSSNLRTKEEVERAAALLNLKVVEQNAVLLTEEEWRAQNEQNSDSEPGEDASSVQSPESPSSPVSPASPTVPDSKSEEETDADDSGNGSALNPGTSYIEYKISQGTTLSGVAEGLLQAGIISDKAAFLQQANAKEINYTVRAGAYQFETGEDYASIIKKLSPSKAAE